MKKLWMKIVIGLLAVLVLVLFFALYIKPWYQLLKSKNLKVDGSPTYEYADFMPDTGEIFKTVEDLVSMGARTPGTVSGEKAKEYVLVDLRIRIGNIE